MQETKQLKGTEPFEANGKRYVFNLDLSIDRFKEFNKMRTILQFAGKDESGLFDDFKAIYNAVNGNTFDRFTVLQICHNNMHNIEYSLDNIYDAQFQLAALFINREGEDVTKFDKALNDAKINDWARAGYTAQSFFVLAASCVKSLQENLKIDFQNSSSEPKAKAAKA